MSDSILATLSTGEYVTRAAAVSKYGTSFMDSINSMTYNPAATAKAATNAGGSTTHSSTYNINVTVNNEDANGIANTIMNTIQRKEKMVQTTRRINI
jgi:hypothetical protein